MEKPYKILDHTGDLGIQVWGHSREELIENASKALMDIMVDISRVTPKKEIEWSIDAESPEELIVKQLQEILYRFDAKETVFSDFQVSLRGLNSVKCLAYGEPLEREKHHFKTEIKAVTYHQLKMGQEGDRWVVQIIFDV